MATTVIISSECDGRREDSGWHTAPLSWRLTPHLASRQNGRQGPTLFFSFLDLFFFFSLLLLLFKQYKFSCGCVGMMGVTEMISPKAGCLHSEIDRGKIIFEKLRRDVYK